MRKREISASKLNSNDPIRYDDREGMTFHCQVRAIAQGGSVTGDGKKLTVTKADAVTLLISAATSFNGPDKSPSRDGLNPATISSKYLEAAAKRPYGELLARHLADYQKLFRRVDLDLGTASEAEALTTEKRLERFVNGQAAPALAVCPRTCKGFGTTRYARRGVLTEPSTSTPR